MEQAHQIQHGKWFLFPEWCTEMEDHAAGYACRKAVEGESILEVGIETCVNQQKALGGFSHLFHLFPA